MISTTWSPSCPPRDGPKATPAPGWTIAHQIAHLLWTDRVALLSVDDEAGFTEVLGAAAEDPSGFVDRGAEEIAAARARRSARRLADHTDIDCTTRC